MADKRRLSAWAVAMILGIAAFGGCSGGKTAPQEGGKGAQAEGKDAKIAAAMHELSDDDRREAEAQKYCAVANTNLLGSMGKPYKVMIEGQPVFLCCDGCEEQALKDPKATLAKVAELKRANSATK
jgi:hypothetical protein